jgi:pimeloyl-ACP methyl ester carboxylesterase
MMSDYRLRPGPAVVVVAITSALLFLASIAASQTPTGWRYDLHPGDHLTYRYTFQRQTQDEGDEFKIEARFKTHVLVVGENADRISLGFERNRESAEMTQYLSKGKDRLAREKVDFDKRMQKRPAYYSEAMEISPTGKPSYSWEVARESASHLLGLLHEVMSLPPVSVTASATSGEVWRDGSVPGLDLRWLGDESIHGKPCHHVEAATPDGAIKVSYWWSPESGVIEQLTLDGSYSLYGSKVHETARMELESRVRGETIEHWLGSPDTRQAALQALLVTPGAPISAEQLAPVLASDEPTSQALALAIASRRKVEVPSGVLDKLRQSTSAVVQVLLDTYSNTGNPAPVMDECRRPLPAKPTPEKFGTSLQVAPASPGSNAGNNDSGGISYLLRVPITYRGDRPTPLLVYLSGGAGFAIDGVNSGEDAVSETDYLVLYPQAASLWWKPEVARRFDSALNDVLRRYNVDRDRIYLTGFSNGGTGSLYFATLWPQRFAAVVSLMGAGQCNDEVKAGLGNLGNLPLLFVHGENDPIINPDCSKITQEALIDLHPAIKPELKILPNHAHDLSLLNDDGLTLAFFKNKIRNPFPRTVDLSETDALADRAYWVEILDGKPGKSDVDARVKADNAIEIHSHDVKNIRLHLRPELLPRPGDVRVVWNGKKMFDGPLRDYCPLSPQAPVDDPKLDLTDTRDFTLP